MISVSVEKEVVDQLIRTEIAKTLHELSHRHMFWDMKELCRQTSMSENFIREHIFFHPKFPKYKVGKKWLMPAKETEAFMLQWLKEQAEH